jgi:hypothetical protein
MSTSDRNTPLKLRAHHICCSRFTNTTHDRGKGFAAAECEAEQALKSDFRSIKVVQGVDTLCAVCPLRSGDWCASPNGSKEKVRKWDSLLLEDLGIAFNTVMDAADRRQFVDERVPFRVCGRCRWRNNCSRGTESPLK